MASGVDRTRAMAKGNKGKTPLAVVFGLFFYLWPMAYEIKLLRFSSGKESTLGALFKLGTDEKGVTHKFLCFTLEDEHREKKVMHDTRIPAGRYRITLRTVGGFHAKTLAKYGAGFHKGMLWVRDVPGFEYILIHTGNTDDHTSGCILVGDSSQQNLTKDGFIGASGDAYKRIYPAIAAALEAGQEVWISIVDLA